MCKDCTNNPNKEEFMFEEEKEAYAIEWGEKTDGTYACIKDGFDEGVRVCKKAADEIIRDLLCLLVDFNNQIIFDDEKQKIKNAEEWLSK